MWNDDGCDAKVDSVLIVALFAGFDLFVKVLGRCLLMWHVVLIAVAAAALHLLHVALFVRATRGTCSGCTPLRCLAALPGIGMFAW